MDAAGLRSRIEATLQTDADNRRQAEAELKAVRLSTSKPWLYTCFVYALLADAVRYRQRRTPASSTPC